MFVVVYYGSSREPVQMGTEDQTANTVPAYSGGGGGKYGANFDTRQSISAGVCGA